MSSPPYVLISAVHNEEQYIHLPLSSVVSQSVPPEKWIIVSDGSTDRTDEILAEWASRHDFIEHVRHEPIDQPGLGQTARRKVAAIARGLELVKDIEYAYLGILDGDISLESTYYEHILALMERSSRIGLAGGLIYGVKQDGTHFPQYDHKHQVAGAVQFFRRECWEDIGGYLPLAWEDGLAAVMVRMEGWEIRGHPTERAFHHKIAGLPGRSLLRAKFAVGKGEYVIGDAFLFMAAKSVRNLVRKPVFLGSLLTFAGYAWALLRRLPIQTPDHVLRYMRYEQMVRLGLGFAVKKPRR